MNHRHLLLALASVLLVSVTLTTLYWLPKSPANHPPPAALGVPQAPAPPAETPASAQNFEFVIKKGARVSGPEVLRVQQGDLLKLKVLSDRADELHLHGYDLHASLPPNQAMTLSFTADHSGRFELELHHSDLLLCVLEVMPR